MNAMSAPLINAAQTLVTNGVATGEDVDRTFMLVHPGAQRGPCGDMDLIGFETIRDMMAVGGMMQKDEPAGQQLLANAAWLDAKVQAGHSGIKAGDPLVDKAQGHYSYPSP